MRKNACIVTALLLSILPALMAAYVTGQTALVLFACLFNLAAAFGFMNFIFNNKEVMQSNTKVLHHSVLNEVLKELEQQYPNIKFDIKIQDRKGNVPCIMAQSQAYPIYTIIIYHDVLRLIGKGLEKEELKLMLTHEIGHLKHQDHKTIWWLKSLQILMGLQMITACGLAFSLGVMSAFLLTGVFIGVGVVQHVVIQTFKRQCEFAADRFAAPTKHKATKLQDLLQKIPKLYHYWGLCLIRHSNNKPMLYSSFDIAPLLERLHYLVNKQDNSETEKATIRQTKAQLAQYFPFNRENHIPSKSMVHQWQSYFLSWFDDYPTDVERVRVLKSYIPRSLHSRPPVKGG